MGSQKRTRDRRIAALADRQHGVAARRQLIALGYTAREIQRRIEAGRLHVSHRGVDAVGRRKLSVRGRWMATVLACGPDAVPSHRDALALHHLRRSGSRAAVHVSAPRQSRHHRKGIVVHERRFLALIREAGLPEPSVNVAVAGVVDFFWPKHRLVVEVDSYAYHHTPADRAEDRREERHLRASGCQVRRITDIELGEAPEVLVGDVAAALSARVAASGR